MNHNKKPKKVLPLVLLAVIILLYLSSIVFAFMGNFQLTLYIFAFNTVFVVIVYFLIRFSKFVTDEDEIEIEENSIDNENNN